MDSLLKLPECWIFACSWNSVRDIDPLCPSQIFIKKSNLACRLSSDSEIVENYMNWCLQSGIMFKDRKSAMDGAWNVLRWSENRCDRLICLRGWKLARFSSEVHTGGELRATKPMFFVIPSFRRRRWWTIRSGSENFIEEKLIKLLKTALRKNIRVKIQFTNWMCAAAKRWSKLSASG